MWPPKYIAMHDIDKTVLLLSYTAQCMCLASKLSSKHYIFLFFLYMHNTVYDSFYLVALLSKIRIRTRNFINTLLENKQSSF